MRRGQESVLQMKPKYGIGARRRQPARPQYIKGLFWSKATLIPIQRITAAGNRAIRAEGALGSGSTMTLWRIGLLRFEILPRLALFAGLGQAAALWKLR